MESIKQMFHRFSWFTCCQSHLQVHSEGKRWNMTIILVVFPVLPVSDKNTWGKCVTVQLYFSSLSYKHLLVPINIVTAVIVQFPAHSEKLQEHKKWCHGPTPPLFSVFPQEDPSGNTHILSSPETCVCAHVCVYIQTHTHIQTQSKTDRLGLVYFLMLTGGQTGRRTGQTGGWKLPKTVTVTVVRFCNIALWDIYITFIRRRGWSLKDTVTCFHW